MENILNNNGENKGSTLLSLLDLNIDLLPIDLFCKIYERKETTVYSWKCRHPELVGIVFFAPKGREIHVSISGYEKWIRGEISTRQASSHMEPVSKSSSKSQPERPTRSKPSPGVQPRVI